MIRGIRIVQRKRNEALRALRGIGFREDLMKAPWNFIDEETGEPAMLVMGELPEDRAEDALAVDGVLGFGYPDGFGVS